MAILRRKKPKKIQNTYSKYKPYLKEVYKESCGYCLLFQDYHEIDHYIPWKRFKPNLKHSHSNLVLSCKICNSKQCKVDYHPDHIHRTRKPRDTSGHLIHNICEEDVILLFSLGVSGRILGRSSRANWLIALFNLNDERYVETRKKVIEMVNWLKNDYPKATAKDKRRLNLPMVAKTAKMLKKRYELLFKILNL